MKTKLILLITMLACALRAAPAITILGANTNDTFTASFWNQKTNANRAITGLNTYGTIKLGTNLIPPNVLSTNLFSAKGQIIVWDGTNAVIVPPGTNGQMIVYDPTTATGLRATNPPTGGGASTNGFNTNIFSAKGDIVVWDGTNAVKFAAGTNGQMIIYDPTTATGLRVTNPPTGGSSPVYYSTQENADLTGWVFSVPAGLTNTDTEVTLAFISLNDEALSPGVIFTNTFGHTFSNPPVVLWSPANPFALNDAGTRQFLGVLTVTTTNFLFENPDAFGLFSEDQEYIYKFIISGL